MILELVTGAASALGSYNLAAWVAKTAITKRRKAKAAISLYRDIKGIIKQAKTIRDAVSDGVSPEEAAIARAVVAKLKGQVTEILTPPAAPAAETPAAK